MENTSEVARILAQIAQEYEAGKSGLQGLAQGVSRHSFITARMENMAKLHKELETLVGEQAIGLVATKLEELGKANTPIVTIQELDSIPR
jgi:hypothetical protein